MPPRPRFDRRAPVRELPNINERIKYPQLRVVDSDGKQLGVIDRLKALEIAKEQLESSFTQLTTEMQFVLKRLENEEHEVIKLEEKTNKFLAQKLFKSFKNVFSACLSL